MTMTTPPTPLMAKVLAHLAGRPAARIYSHGLESLGVCGVSLTEAYGRARLRVTRSTLKAMLNRGLIELDREEHNGGITGTSPDGSHGIVDRSFGRYYRITEKGRIVAHAPQAS